MFYPAMILGALRTTETIGVADVVTLSGVHAYKVHRNDDDQDAIATVTSLDSHPSDVHIGSAEVSNLLMSGWMPPLVQDHTHLQLLPCTMEALSHCKYGWPCDPVSLRIHVDGSFCP